MLREYYRHCREKVSSDERFVMWTEEKLVHSFQVVGSGNYIMRHESIFSDSDDAAFLRDAKLAYLFHDIGRFREIELRYDERPAWKIHDHSLYSYEILKGMPEYARPEILLPVKHHGHMIEALYADAGFADLPDENLKKSVEAIAFLVRDADKTANFYLLKNMAKFSRTQAEQIFFGNSPRGTLSEGMISDFFAEKMPSRSAIKTVGDWMLSYLSWIYDLNYRTSFDFCRKTGVFEMMIALLDEYNDDKVLQKKLERTIFTYIENRYQQFGRKQR